MGLFFRGYVLRYLAVLARGGTRAEARSAVPAGMWPWVFRLARKWVVAAGFDTNRADDEAHVHRLAYLRVLGVPPLNADDVDGVQKTYDEHRNPQRETAAWRGPALAVVLLALFVVASAAAWSLSQTPARMPGGPTAIPSTGGPVTAEPPEAPSHPLEPAFEEHLPAYVMALDRNADDDVARTRQTLLDTLQPVSPPIAAAMRDVLDEAQAYSASTGQEYDLSRWYARLALLHDALEDEGVPFYVDAMLLHSTRRDRHRALVSTYDVRARRSFRTDAGVIRQLDIERLDTLNFDRALLGYTRPEGRYALVVLDRIERFLIRAVLPSVHSAADSVIVRGYENESGIEWVTDFEEQAHEDLRREAEAVVAAQMGDARALDALAEAVVQRRNAIRRVRSVFGRRVRLRDPRRLEYDVDRLAAQVGDSASVAPVRQAERALQHPAARRAYRLLLEARALSVAEHEVQHRLDYAGDRLIAIPETLSQYTGDTEELERVNRRAERANAELSAYLSQIARRPSLACTSLIHVVSFLMSRRNWSKPEAYAGAALVEAMADEADLPHRALIARRRVDRAEVARLYAALRALGPEALSALASRTWTRLYGTPLPPLEQL